MSHKKQRFLSTWTFVAFTVLIMFGCSDKQNEDWYTIYGGVIGGSFSQFAGVSVKLSSIMNQIQGCP